MMTTGVYIHRTELNEQRRLSILNDLLNEGSLRTLPLRPGERVLDVGSGLGQLTRAMARAIAPGGRVVGVERSAEQLSVARRLADDAEEEDRVDLREGDATDLPLAADEWGRRPDASRWYGVFWAEETRPNAPDTPRKERRSR